MLLLTTRLTYISRKKGSRATLFKSSFPLKRGIFRFREYRRLVAIIPIRGDQRWELFLRLRDIICIRGRSGCILWAPARVKMRERIFRGTLEWLRLVVILDTEHECLYVYVTELFIMRRAQMSSLNEIRFEHGMRMIWEHWLRYSSEVSSDILC